MKMEAEAPATTVEKNIFSEIILKDTTPSAMVAELLELTHRLNTDAFPNIVDILSMPSDDLMDEQFIGDEIQEYKDFVAGYLQSNKDPYITEGSFEKCKSIYQYCKINESSQKARKMIFAKHLRMAIDIRIPFKVLLLRLHSDVSNPGKHIRGFENCMKRRAWFVQSILNSSTFSIVHEDWVVPISGTTDHIQTHENRQKLFKYVPDEQKWEENDIFNTTAENVDFSVDYMKQVNYFEIEYKKIYGKYQGLKCDQSNRTFLNEFNRKTNEFWSMPVKPPLSPFTLLEQLQFLYQEFEKPFSEMFTNNADNMEPFNTYEKQYIQYQIKMASINHTIKKICGVHSILQQRYHNISLFVVPHILEIEKKLSPSNPHVDVASEYQQQLAIIYAQNARHYSDSTLKSLLKHSFIRDIQRYFCMKVLQYKELTPDDQITARSLLLTCHKVKTVAKNTNQNNANRIEDISDTIEYFWEKFGEISYYFNALNIHKQLQQIASILQDDTESETLYKLKKVHDTIQKHQTDVDELLEKILSQLLNNDNAPIMAWSMHADINAVKTLLGLIQKELLQSWTLKQQYIHSGTQPYDWREHNNTSNQQHKLQFALAHLVEEIVKLNAYTKLHEIGDWRDNEKDNETKKEMSKFYLRLRNGLQKFWSEVDELTDNILHNKYIEIGTAEIENILNETRHNYTEIRKIEEWHFSREKGKPRSMITVHPSDQPNQEKTPQEKKLLHIHNNTMLLQDIQTAIKQLNLDQKIRMLTAMKFRPTVSKDGNEPRKPTEDEKTQIVNLRQNISSVKADFDAVVARVNTLISTNTSYYLLFSTEWSELRKYYKNEQKYTTDFQKWYNYINKKTAEVPPDEKVRKTDYNHRQPQKESQNEKVLKPDYNHSRKKALQDKEQQQSKKHDEHQHTEQDSKADIWALQALQRKTQPVQEVMLYFEDVLFPFKDTYASEESVDKEVIKKIANSNNLFTEILKDIENYHALHDELEKLIDKHEHIDKDESWYSAENLANTIASKGAPLLSLQNTLDSDPALRQLLIPFLKKRDNLKKIEELNTKLQKNVITLEPFWQEMLDFEENLKNANAEISKKQRDENLTNSDEQTQMKLQFESNKKQQEYFVKIRNKQKGDLSKCRDLFEKLKTWNNKNGNSDINLETDYVNADHIITGFGNFVGNKVWRINKKGKKVNEGITSYKTQMKKWYANEIQVKEAIGIDIHHTKILKSIQEMQLASITHMNTLDEIFHTNTNIRQYQKSDEQRDLEEEKRQIYAGYESMEEQCKVILKNYRTNSQQKPFDEDNVLSYITNAESEYLDSFETLYDEFIYYVKNLQTYITEKKNREIIDLISQRTVSQIIEAVQDDSPIDGLQKIDHKFEQLLEDIKKANNSMENWETDHTALEKALLEYEAQYEAETRRVKRELQSSKLQGKVGFWLQHTTSLESIVKSLSDLLPQAIPVVPPKAEKQEEEEADAEEADAEETEEVEATAPAAEPEPEPVPETAAETKAEEEEEEKAEAEATKEQNIENTALLEEITKQRKEFPGLTSAKFNLYEIETDLVQAKMHLKETVNLNQYKKQQEEYEKHVEKLRGEYGSLLEKEKDLYRSIRKKIENKSKQYNYKSSSDKEQYDAIISELTKKLDACQELAKDILDFIKKSSTTKSGKKKKK